MNVELHRCEVLIIGSGPGGSVTASTLASHGKDVLLLEEGPNLSIRSCQPFSIEEVRQKYRSGGMNPAFGNPIIPFAEGCCAGGGSEINSGMYHRTPLETLDLWKRCFQVEHLEPQHLSPHFESCESVLAVRSNPGSSPGPALKMNAGAGALGWETKEVPRWFKYSELPGRNGIFTGTRQSMTETFIPSALSSGCRFLTGIRAERLRRRRNQWELTATRGAATATFLADTVFVSCGAVQTPALLRRSGLRTNIGNSLAMHPTVKVVALFPEEVNNHPADVAAQQVSEFVPHASMGCSVSSQPYLSLAMLDHPDAPIDVVRNWRRAAIYYVMIAGPSSGRVRNVPFSADPLVRYPLEQEHLRALSSSLRNLCRLLLAAGATDLYPAISGSGPLRSESDLSQLPAALPRSLTSLMTIHLFSSCPMGELREVCAVDSFGRVHGQQNLFVNDASLLCTAPGVNPQGTIMALARRNALHFARAL